ncbi:hypothetical protein BDV41DRAFT_543027 [Aspergillus transmontanensis]|uniref:Uncharacterized protein n=1 Tax=Aspergillus transmontanensis TaxID=1034304 RepID=A0A5N6VRF1_9EURO|nr:hypothetical protein BDV41DRAFT_543027 [Aspergillus transmontanensis]
MEVKISWITRGLSSDCFSDSSCSGSVRSLTVLLFLFASGPCLSYCLIVKELASVSAMIRFLATCFISTHTIAPDRLMV